MNFSELMASMTAAGDGFSVEIGEEWMQGRTTYGGLSAALCLEAARRRFPDAPPLRSAQVSFIGPAGGTVSAEATLLRQGKSVTFVEANVAGEKGLATRTSLAFGAARSSALEFTNQPAPDLPGPEQSKDFFAGGVGPNFTRHFDVRLARGALPVSGSDVMDHYLWVRHKDRGATSVTALMALADMPPPAVLPMFTEFAPVSSMTWMINMLTETPKTADGWWLLQSRAENAAHGYSSQDMTIWNMDGEPVVTGRQSVAIFA